VDLSAIHLGDIDPDPKVLREDGFDPDLLDYYEKTPWK
jgi:hypothetical protein